MNNEKFKKLLNIVIRDGFVPKTISTNWTVEHFTIKSKPLVNETCIYLLLEEINQWIRNKKKIYVIISPIVGSKNYYDSFPIIGWQYDSLETNKGTDNSYYMGYPVLQWFTAEESCFDPGETLEDINIEKFDTYEEALENGLYNSLNIK